MTKRDEKAELALSRIEQLLATLAPGGAIGIDPGSASGAIAYVSDTQACAFPIGELTDQDIWQLVSRLARVARVAVLERVGPMPKQGVSSTFKFGASYGQLRMALAASGVAWHLVPPNQWQREMNCRTGGDKAISRARAQQLFPNLNVSLKCADALLLALYARTKDPQAGVQLPAAAPLPKPKPKRMSKKALEAALTEFL